MQIIISKPRKEDVSDLARFTYEVRHASPLHNANRTIESIEKALHKSVNNTNSIIIQAHDEESSRIIGWLKLYTGFPTMVFIDPWHPIVESTDNGDLIAEALIARAKEYTREIGFTRLEAIFNQLNDQLRPFLELYQQWYENQKLSWVVEEATMSLFLKGFKRKRSITHEGFKLIPFKDTAKDEIEIPFFETFLDSQDGLFLDMTRTNQETAFNYWFDKSRPYYEKASSVLMHGKQIAGFCIVRSDEDCADIGPIGINPDFRRRGLGAFLLESCLHALTELGVIKASLEVSIENKEALALYHKFGFQQLYTTVYHAWKVD